MRIVGEYTRSYSKSNKNSIVILGRGYYMLPHYQYIRDGISISNVEIGFNCGAIYIDMTSTLGNYILHARFGKCVFNHQNIEIIRTAIVSYGESLTLEALDKLFDLAREMLPTIKNMGATELDMQQRYTKVCIFDNNDGTATFKINRAYLLWIEARQKYIFIHLQGSRDGISFCNENISISEIVNIIKERLDNTEQHNIIDTYNALLNGVNDVIKYALKLKKK